MLTKSFKLGFNNMWTENFQMYKLDLEKAEKSLIKLPTSTHLHRESKEIPEKASTSTSLTMLKLLTAEYNKLENS